MPNPTASVVMATYNRAALVSEAIDSVLQQTMQAFELLVIDDGSTDETAATIRAFADARLRHICQANAGAAEARNRGWRESSGRYILFMDDDDRLHTGALEALLQRAAEVPEAGMIGADHEYMDAEGNVLGTAELWKLGENLDLAALVLCCPFAIGATLVRREWLERVGGFDAGQIAAQDWDLWLRLVQAGCTATWSKSVVCQYRLHPGSLSGDPEKHKRGAIRALDKVFSHRDLPDTVERLRGRAYGRIYLRAAARAYAEGSIKRAHEDLASAAVLLTEWVESGVLLERLLRSGNSPIVTRDPHAYTATVLANLPPGLFSVRSQRHAQARVAAAEFFAARFTGDSPSLRRLWWNMVTKDPSWLRNRGVMSIWIESVVGSRAAGMVRMFLRRLWALWTRCWGT
jgi:glycosyltransferase involved in cell wall biosynthesis